MELKSPYSITTHKGRLLLNSENTQIENRDQLVLFLKKIRLRAIQLGWSWPDQYELQPPMYPHPRCPIAKETHGP